MAKFSLSWESYKSNICSGLSSLQQKGEFVDMTIAADGHHVKVHRMVMSLVSPYIKELLASADCQHPVIFLNKTSYSTLCAILEYVYTGEVMVDKDNLSELIEAGKELRITGLEDMNVEVEIPSHGQFSHSITAQHNEGQPLAETGYFDKEIEQKPNINTNSQIKNVELYKEDSVADLDQSEIQALDDDTDDNTYDDYAIETYKSTVEVKEKLVEKAKKTEIQYTLTNQGALQLILNRYMYYLRYTSRKEHCCQRSWKCIHNARTRTQCPATVITRDDVVIKRFGAHSHPFHDKKILRKVRDSAIFTALRDAEDKIKKKTPRGQ